VGAVASTVNLSALEVCLIVVVPAGSVVVFFPEMFPGEQVVVSFPEMAEPWAEGWSEDGVLASLGMVEGDICGA